MESKLVTMSMPQTNYSNLGKPTYDSVLAIDDRLK